MDLAIKYNTHIDTVAFFREKYLGEVGRSEELEKYLKLKGKIELDWNVIQRKIKLDLEGER